MLKHEKILIVGGGIAGLTLAAFLRPKGIRVDLIEKAPTLRPVGAGISLNANAVKILQELGIEAQITNRSHILKRIVFTNQKGKKIVDLDTTELDKTYGYSIASHRMVLHEALEDAAGKEHNYTNTTLEKYQHHNDKAEVWWQNKSHSYDLVVGADGIRSQIRQEFFSQNPSIYSGYTCWRFVVPNSIGLTHPIKMLGAGKQFGIVPIGENKLYCFTTLNAPAKFSLPQQSLPEELKRIYQDFQGYAPEVLSQLKENSEIIAGDIEEVNQKLWYKDRFVLIGDAAHAMTPNMGQGGAMAVEDAKVLAEEICRNQNLTQTLANYQKRRFPRVNWIKARSQRIGQVCQWQSLFGCKTRNFFLRCFGKKLMSKTLSQIVANK